MTYSKFFIVQLLYDWQTLVGGLLALGAAIWALKPIYGQLALARAQNDAILREKIGEMIVQLDANAVQSEIVLSERMAEFSRGLQYFEFREKDYEFDDWCGQKQSEFTNAEYELKGLFARSHEVEAIEAGRAQLLAALSSLNGVLWDIYAPEYYDRDPEECSWTEKERTVAIARSIEAQGEVQSYADKIAVARGHLHYAFAEQRSSLVRRLRVIDDRLLDRLS